jgi:hypothetical protein
VRKRRDREQFRITNGGGRSQCHEVSVIDKRRLKPFSLSYHKAKRLATKSGGSKLPPYDYAAASNIFSIKIP